MGATRNQSWRHKFAARIAGAASLARGRARPFLVVLLLVGGVTGGAFYIRHRWPEAVSPHRHFTAEHLIVTPQPKWIDGDVKADVLRDARLDELDLFDPELTRRIAEAFSVHSWVAEVKSVRKSADSQRQATIDVQLEYRRPIAMVQVIDRGKPGLLWVDSQGVLLPPEDFSESDVPYYLRIGVSGARPAGPIGTSWGDKRVLDAARIAAAWQNEPWRKLGLYLIEVEGDAPQSGRQAVHNYSIYTKNGRRILWGRPPGEEGSGEATASQKIARLLQHVETEGPLDKQPEGDIDLRDAQGLRILSRTARLFTPTSVHGRDQ